MEALIVTLIVIGAIAYLAKSFFAKDGKACGGCDSGCEVRGACKRVAPDTKSG